MKKNIIKELNRVREMMGLGLVTEQSDDTLIDDEGNRIEVETETVTLGEIDDEYADEVIEQEDEEMIDDEGNSIEVDSETITLGEQDEKEELKPGAVVSIRKEYRVQLGGTGWKLIPYLQYKYNKQHQKHVPGSAFIRLKVAENNVINSRFSDKNPNKVDIYNTDRGLSEALYKVAAKSKEKMPLSATKRMVDYFTTIASKAGLGINIDTAFGANWKKQDTTRWIYDYLHREDGTRLAQDGARGKYVSNAFEYPNRDEGYNARQAGWEIKYYPKGKNQVSVTFNKWGGVRDKWGKWFKLVSGVQSRQEMYEFCQVIPPGLKKTKKWKESKTFRGNTSGISLDC